MNNDRTIDNAINQGQGILRLAPNWVPRLLCVPGKRIKLHPDDYYVLGSRRGAITERWLASTTPADNGPLTAESEGLSFFVFQDGTDTERVTLQEAVEQLKEGLVGQLVWEKFQSWPLYSKFFDNRKALPLHIHHRPQHAALVGQLSKPEAYYFPPQLNNYDGNFPYTFFGLRHGTTKQNIRKCLMEFDKGDNRILNMSRAYRLQLGTGWNVPPGLLHAPGSLCTYEPQMASDVFAVYQSFIGDNPTPKELLWNYIPQEKANDTDYLLELLDWDLNLDPEFETNNFMQPKPVAPLEEMKEAGYIENWICYKSAEFSAKELTVLPGRSVILKDHAAYGLIMMQGHGKMGSWNIETPTMIRYGQITNDEFFVSAQAASAGVEIVNHSRSEPIVMLKHFGPGHPALAT